MRLILLLALTLLPFQNAHAWGKRGHSIVCQTAAYLAAKDPKAEFLQSHSFDLGYYCNVPDLVWKKPATYEVEWTNHFMDMEIFNREIKADERHKAFEEDRVTFNSTHPQIKDEAGRAFWRVNEMMGALARIAAELRVPGAAREEHQKAQTQWLLHAGAIGHYIGDLAQPLHVTENYDGQLTDQKGIHAFFEDQVVDHLFLGEGVGLEGEIFKKAEQKWKKLAPQWEKKTPLQIMEDLAVESNKEIPALLKLDKKVGRKDVRKAALAYRSMIVDRIATGSIALAVLWKKNLGWEYDGKRFFAFLGTPDYIYPPKPQPVSQPVSQPAPTPAPTPAP